MDIIKTQRTYFWLTTACPLKCKLCSALSPYIKKYNPAFDTLKNQADAFFRIVDRTENITMTGGEPLLRSIGRDTTLEMFLNYVSDNYSERFDWLQIITSGTIVANDNLFNTIKEISREKKFHVLVDNYGLLSNKIGDLVDKLIHYEINHTVRDYYDNPHFGGWLDFRDTAKRKHNPREQLELFSNCGIINNLGWCPRIFDGILSLCPATANRYICGEISRDNEDIIDLLDDPQLMREKLAKLIYSKDSPLESCAYCDGVNKNSKRFAPAEQASTDEIEKWRENHKMRF